MIKRGKKGVTLVELIVAIAVIALVVVGTVTGVVLAQQNIINDSLKENASLKAQQIADTLAADMTGKTFKENQENAVKYGPDKINGAVYTALPEDNFPAAKDTGEVQFTILKSTVAADSTTVDGTRILVAVYYRDNNSITVEAFASAGE